MTRSPQPSPTDPTHEDNWAGGFYELSIKLDASDDARLDMALAALWRAASLPSPFRRESDEAVDVSARSLLAGPLHSVATIPGLGSTLCEVILLRVEDEEPGLAGSGDDWLDLGLPLGALGRLDDRVGAYPFGDLAASRGWREPVEEWFATVASAVFEAVPFVHAVTGDDATGTDPSEVERGEMGVFRRSPEGGLEVEPVRTWF